MNFNMMRLGRKTEKEPIYYDDQEFGVMGKPHPLLIPSIAFKILRYLNYADLSALRCVCTQWEYEAAHLLQPKTQIRLAGDDQVEKFLKDFPCKNYSCVSFEFGRDLFLKAPSLQEFFSRYGNEIKSLKLHTAEWSNWQLWDLISEKLPHLQELSVRIFIPKYGHLFPDPDLKPTIPNIKKLNLSFNIDHPDIYFTNPTILKELFLALPNLEVLSCPNWPTIIEPSTTVSTLVFNVILSEEEIKFNNLAYLNITASLSNEELYALLNKQFPLRELHLEISPSVRGVYLLCLLASIEDSLETLSLTFPNYYDVCQFETFPTLRKLHSLSLHKFRGSLESVVTNCKTLKKLILNDVTLKEVYWAERDNNFNAEELLENRANANANMDGREEIVSDHMLEELIIQENDSPIGHIKVLAKLFPNLKVLSMQNISDTVLRVIFAKLPSLEEFIAQGNFTDCGVTGFSQDVCKMLMAEDKIICPFLADKLRVELYLGTLYKLKRLILESKSITYLSAIYGARQCKNLVYKRISSYN